METLSLKIIYKPKVDLRLPQIELGIVPLSHRPGQVENTRLCFEGQPETGSEKSVVLFYVGDVVPAPASVNQRVKK